jgi:hypothetical protein
VDKSWGKVTDLLCYKGKSARKIILNLDHFANVTSLIGIDAIEQSFLLGRRLFKSFPDKLVLVVDGS